MTQHPWPSTKLQRWELEHLRSLVAEQQARIEQLERALHSAEVIAEQWQLEAEALREDVGTRGGVVQLYADGSMAIAYGAGA